MSRVNLLNDEINLFVYRYLQESGFKHSAHVFGYESDVYNTNIDNALVPSAALLRMIHKGIELIETEINVDENYDDYRSINSLPELLQLKPNSYEEEETNSKMEIEQFDDYEPFAVDMIASVYENIKLEHDSSKKQSLNIKTNGAVKGNAKTIMDLNDYTLDNSITFPSSKYTVLKGHESEVFFCSWNPTRDLLVSGSSDSTARLWDMTYMNFPNPITLRHSVPNGEADSCVNKDVTCLHWNDKGTFLATGCYDGYARIWNTDGTLFSILGQHKGPIFALKWNKIGNYLLSAGVDKTTIIWDAINGTCLQQFSFHYAPALDVDWKTNFVFASCSTDHCIYVCQLGLDYPIKTFGGHSKEVNAIKWDPQGKLLASCSDDMTLKIWCLDQNTPVHNLQSHSKEIYTLKWSPTGPATDNPNLELIIASASFDATVRLWEVERGTCLRTLAKHTEPVYTVAFSPDGQFVATGGFDRYVHIWSIQSGVLINSYKAKGGIFEVSWNSRGDKIAACAADGNITVLDLRK